MRWLELAAGQTDDLTILILSLVMTLEILQTTSQNFTRVFRAVKSSGLKFFLCLLQSRLTKCKCLLSLVEPAERIGQGCLIFQTRC